ncbi:MAG: RNA polymerase sigma factor [Myxococcota bacterium]
MDTRRDHLTVVPDSTTGSRATNLDGLADDDLMLLAAGGMHAAFERLVRRHQALVYGTSCRYLGDAHAAREVTQEVFVALWAERQRYEARGKFKSFLLARTFNRCHLTARSRRNQRKKIDHFERDGAPMAPADSPIDGLLREARAREVRARLTLLPEAMRQALILRYLDDQSIEEVATTMRRPVGTIKSYIFRGLRRLAKETAEETP